MLTNYRSPARSAALHDCFRDFRSVGLIMPDLSSASMVLRCFSRWQSRRQSHLVEGMMARLKSQAELHPRQSTSSLQLHPSQSTTSISCEDCRQPAIAILYRKPLGTITNAPRSAKMHTTLLMSETLALLQTAADSAAAEIDYSCGSHRCRSNQHFRNSLLLSKSKNTDLILRKMWSSLSRARDSQ